MSTQITLTLRDDVFKQAEFLAELSKKKVEDLLTNAIETSLSPVESPEEYARPMSDLNDKEIVALTKLEMPQKQDKRLSLLLNKQQADTLTEKEKAELQKLMKTYQSGLLRKAQALREAVCRGLIEPLTP